MRISRRGGFTLVEIMVGLAVFGAAMLVAIPSMSEFNEHRRTQETVSNMESQLRRARSTAVSKGCNVRFLVLPSSQGYLLMRDNEGDGNYSNYMGHKIVPHGVKMTDVEFGGGTWLTFNPRGMPDNPGFVRLVSRNGQGMELRVAAGSGTVSVVKYEVEG